MEKWKGGIQRITALQMTKINLMGGSIMILGVIIGLITTFIQEIWWLFIVLIGSLFLTTTTLLGMIQKYNTLKKWNSMN